MSKNFTATALKETKNVRVNHGAFITGIKNVNNRVRIKLRAASEQPPTKRDEIKVRVAVKDNIATSRSKTTCASGILQNYESPYEATVVQKLRNAGYLIAGKTNMDEFGMGSYATKSFFGPVHNRKPWPHLTAGGSSGGSAVAVAEGLSEFALGTDTGGSVRLPAAYVGKVGFKPSYGRISRWGVIPYANSLDTVGIFAQSASKNPLHRTHFPLQRLFKTLEGYDPQDPTSVTEICRKRLQARNHEFAFKTNRWGKTQFKALRIGVPAEYNIKELHDTVRQTWINVLEGLQLRGHTIVPVSLPSTKHALSAYYVLAPAEAASNLSKFDGVRYGTRSDGSDRGGGVLYAEVRGSGLGEEVRRRILLGSYTLSSEAIDNYFIKAQKVRRLVQRDFDRVFAMPNPLHEPEQFDLSDLDEGVRLENKLGPAQVDVLVCPTAPTLPPSLADVESLSSVDSYMNDIFTVPASLAGLPAISVPARIPFELRRPGSVPFAGVQVIGQYWDDFHVIHVGGIIENLHNRGNLEAIKSKIAMPNSN